jgi:hypothetical protein
LLSALTHSLLLRDRLQQDLADARASIAHAVNYQPNGAASAHAPSAVQPLLLAGGKDDSEGSQQQAIRDEWERLEVRKKRDKERQLEVEQRERTVGEREKWVVAEMR